MNFAHAAVGTVASSAAALTYYNKNSFYMTSERSKILIPWSKLDYPGDLDMFNGLENMGSDGTRYKEACKWFSAKAAKDKWKIIVACTIVLEKPSGILFSGMTGEQKSKFRALDNRVKEACTTMKNTLSAFSTIHENASEEMKDSALENAVMSIMAYVLETEWDGDGEFPGYVMVASHEQIGVPKAFYDLIVLKLESMPKAAGWGSHFSNINFNELIQIKITAMNVYLNPEVANYLPTLTSKEIRNRTTEQKAEMDKVRANWDPVFQTVNVSRAKVVAMLAMTYQPHLFPIQADWVEKYSGRPFRAKCPESTNPKTKEIWNTNIKKFMEDKKLYKKEARKVFGSQWYVGLEPEERLMPDVDDEASTSTGSEYHGDEDDDDYGVKPGNLGFEAIMRLRSKVKKEVAVKEEEKMEEESVEDKVDDELEVDTAVAVKDQGNLDEIFGLPNVEGVEDESNNVPDEDTDESPRDVSVETKTVSEVV